jgi:hypothetical protein
MSTTYLFSANHRPINDASDPYDKAMSDFTKQELCCQYYPIISPKEFSNSINRKANQLADIQPPISDLDSLLALAHFSLLCANQLTTSYKMSVLVLSSTHTQRGTALLMALLCHL